MEENEVYRTAKGFIAVHGAKVAWQHALVRAVNQADMTGKASWLRVVDAIDEMTRTTPHPAETIQ